MSHYRDFGSAVLKICAGTTGNWSVGFQTQKETDLSELTAFNEQWEYLQRKRNQTCMTPECEKEVDFILNWILNEAIPGVINGTYGRL